MAMNSDKLLISINKRLEEYGIINDVTCFFREHPEYFTEQDTEGHIVATCSITIAMVCKPEERQTRGVLVVEDIGSYSTTLVCLTDHSRSIKGSKPYLKRTIDRKNVSTRVVN